jgi:hypothetical protein
MAERLHVRVAENAIHGAHCVSNCNRTWIGVSQRHCVTELCGRCCGVCDDSGAVDGVCTIRGIQVLPGPPYSIDLSMMKVKPVEWRQS